MNLLNKETQLRNIDCYNSKSLQSYRPSVIWVEPTNTCNLRCVMCPQSDNIMTRKKGFMKFSLLEKIIDEVKEWKPTIKFFHLGESLMHPRIGDMIKYASERGCYTMMNSNATLLEEKQKEIFESGLDYISFSFDGVTKEVYEKIRKGANFEKTLTNIINFLDVKKERGYEKPYVNIEMIRMDDTEKEVEKFRKKFEDYPVDKITVKKLVNWTGGVDVEGDIPQIYTDLSCIHPWSFSVVLWDGKVVPCCRDYNGGLVLGDVNEKKLIDIWNNGQEMRNLRETLAKENGFKDIEICKNCSEIYTEWNGISSL